MRSTIINEKIEVIQGADQIFRYVALIIVHSTWSPLKK